jgi:hypothetical protein
LNLSFAAFAAVDPSDYSAFSTAETALLETALASAHLAGTEASREACRAMAAGAVEAAQEELNKAEEAGGSQRMTLRGQHSFTDEALRKSLALTKAMEAYVQAENRETAGTSADLGAAKRAVLLAGFELAHLFRFLRGVDDEDDYEQAELQAAMTADAFATTETGPTTVPLDEAQARVKMLADDLTRSVVEEKKRAVEVGTVAPVRGGAADSQRKMSTMAARALELAGEDVRGSSGGGGSLKRVGSGFMSRKKKPSWISTPGATSAAATSSSTRATSSKEYADDEAAPVVSKSVLPKSLQPVTFPDDINQWTQAMRTVWARPPAETSLMKDLFRLARRLRIIDASGETLLDPEDDSRSILEVLGDAFTTLVLALEQPERARECGPAIDAFGSSASETPDLAIRRMYEDHVGWGSRTCTIMRPIHQGMAMPYAVWLRKKTRLLSKDVTSKDGWRVIVQLPPEREGDKSAAPPGFSPWPEFVPGVDCAVVTHYRKEQSIGDPDNSAQRFTFEARIRFYLDLTKSSDDALRRVDLRFDKISRAEKLNRDVDESLQVLSLWNMYAEQLERILSYGGI